MLSKLNSLTLALVSALILGAVGRPSSFVAAAPPYATSPSLGAAVSYSVLGGETVTNTGATTVSGDLGVSPGSAVVGFPPGVVGPPGVVHAADQSAADAQAANTAAFIALDQGCDVTYATTQDLTLVSPLGPGVYCADAFTLSGGLVLSGTVGVWIFKSAADLNTAANSSVTGGDPCNVWWRLVSSATLFSGTDFVGNILADTSITLQTGASLIGRAFARTGQVALAGSTISDGECLGAPVATSTPTSTSTSTPTQPTNTPTATATNTPTQATNTPTATSTSTPTGATSTATATNTPLPGVATNTPTAAATTAPQNTAIPAATSLPAPTVTVPAVVGLPATGGGPLPVQTFPWGQALLLAGLGVMALGLSAVARPILRRRGR